MPQAKQPTSSKTDAPDLWVLGGFTMTGSAISRHAGEIVASALAADLRVLTLAFQPGAFAEADVRRAVEDGRVPGRTGIVYLRSVTRLGPPAGRFRAWRSRWRALRQLVRDSDHVVLLRERRGVGWKTAHAQSLLGFALRLGLTNTAIRTADAAAADILAQDLTLRSGAVSPGAAEERVIAHIRANSTQVLKLTDVHVMRALRHPDNAALPQDVRDDLVALTKCARKLTARDIETAVRHRSLRGHAGAPRAVQAAYAPSERWPDMPRIAEHLRLIGKRRQFWAQFIPPDQPGQWSGRDRGAVVLRHLAGMSDPEDMQELASLSRPVLGDTIPLSRLDWYLMMAIRCGIPDMPSLLAPWASAQMIDSVRDATQVVGTSTRRSLSGEPVLRLIGIAANRTGLAQNFWMSAQAVGRAGIAPELRPLDTTERPPQTVPLVSGAHPKLRIQRDVTLFHVNADRIPREILAEEQNRTPFNIGYLLWELDRIPPAHQLALDMLDEIWVPSNFLKRVYAPRFERDVILMRKALDLPAAVAWPGPPRGVRRFAVCFDQRSSVGRKNPVAAVNAFTDAFAGRNDVELLIKTTPDPESAGWSDTDHQIRQIEEIAASDARVSLIKSHLPMPQLLGLIATADALISPHRAEGFGYFPAFALSLGVPVIATDYSGTQDFCSPATSFPVPGEMVPVPDGHMPWHTPGARWAEVDRRALAQTMQKVLDNPVEARARALRGQAIMTSDYAPAALTRRYAQRLEELGLAERANAGPATQSALVT